MKIVNIEVTRIIKEVSVVVQDYNGNEFVICGEIVNNELERDSIAVVYYQASEFRKLKESDAEKIKLAAYNEFKKIESL